jgi:cytochrome b pre-mRNA-processing protein 3
MFAFFKSRRQADRHIESLYQANLQAARAPAFYETGGIPDTPEGRFEMIALHVILTIRRLNREGETGRAAGQALFDHMFEDIGHVLREMGVGDTSVGKKKRDMAEAFFGRFKAYSEAMEAQDADARVAAFGRNLSEVSAEADAARIAGYFEESDALLARQDLLSYGSGAEVRFPDFSRA